MQRIIVKINFSGDVWAYLFGFRLSIQCMSGVFLDRPERNNFSAIFDNENSRISSLLSSRVKICPMNHYFAQENNNYFSVTFGVKNTWDFKKILWIQIVCSKYVPWIATPPKSSFGRLRSKVERPRPQMLFSWKSCTWVTVISFQKIYQGTEGVDTRKFFWV